MQEPNHRNYSNDNEDDGCCNNQKKTFKNIPHYLPPIISFTLLIVGLAFSCLLKLSFFEGVAQFIWYFVAYLPVGLPVLQSSISTFKQGSYFNEFSLMLAATIGAFFIGEYPEGVAVMLFYSVGEWLQERAVRSAKNIKALLDVRPNSAHVLRGEHYQTIDPKSVVISEIIQIKVGEKIPLDGELITEKAMLNNAALTGESKPQRHYLSDSVMAGAINLENVIDIRVTKGFDNNAIARILTLVQDAANRKSKIKNRTTDSEIGKNLYPNCRGAGGCHLLITGFIGIRLRF